MLIYLLFVSILFVVTGVMCSATIAAVRAKAQFAVLATSIFLTGFSALCAIVSVANVYLQIQF